MLMHNPPHPGEVVRSILIEDAGISITDAANILSVTRGALSKLINCHTGISPEMAIRLSIALNTSSQMWLNLQSNYELWQAEQRRTKLLKQVSTVKRYLDKYKKRKISTKKNPLIGKLSPPRQHKKAS